MQLALESLKGINELVIVGNGAVESANRLRQTYRPGILLLASNDTIDFGLFKGREAQNQPVFYCCEAGNCSLPETNEAIVVEKLDVKPA
jgi:hypothetical protein